MASRQLISSVRSPRSTFDPLFRMVRRKPATGITIGTRVQPYQSGNLSLAHRDQIHAQYFAGNHHFVVPHNKCNLHWLDVAIISGHGHGLDLMGLDGLTRQTDIRARNVVILVCHSGAHTQTLVNGSIVRDSAIRMALRNGWRRVIIAVGHVPDFGGMAVCALAMELWHKGYSFEAGFMNAIRRLIRCEWTDTLRYFLTLAVRRHVAPCLGDKAFNIINAVRRQPKMILDAELPTVWIRPQVWDGIKKVILAQPQERRAETARRLVQNVILTRWAGLSAQNRLLPGEAEQMGKVLKLIRTRRPRP